MSPVFAIKVSKIVNEFFIKKVIDENKAKLKENDQQNVPPSDIIKKNNDNVIKNIPSSSAILSNSIAQREYYSQTHQRDEILLLKIMIV